MMRFRICTCKFIRKCLCLFYTLPTKLHINTIHKTKLLHITLHSYATVRSLYVKSSIIFLIHIMVFSGVEGRLILRIFDRKSFFCSVCSNSEAIHLIVNAFGARAKTKPNITQFQLSLLCLCVCMRCLPVLAYLQILHLSAFYNSE